MKRWAASVAAATSAALLCTVAAHATSSGEQSLAKFSAAWEKVSAYTCTITAHEVAGSNVQDRVYDFWFQKPHSTRMNITGGDGHGSAVIWDGGDRVYGHKGGMLSMFSKHLDLHDPQATSIRGTTVAEANFGALLEHAKSLKGATVDAVRNADVTNVTIAVADPSSDHNVTKERFVLGASDLPIEYDQWEGDTLVKQVKYADVKLNGTIDASVFQRL